MHTANRFTVTRICSCDCASPRLSTAVQGGRGHYTCVTISFLGRHWFSLQTARFVALLAMFKNSSERHQSEKDEAPRAGPWRVESSLCRDTEQTALHGTATMTTSGR